MFKEKHATKSFVCFFWIAVHKRGCYANGTEYCKDTTLQHIWVKRAISLDLYNIQLVSLLFADNETENQCGLFWNVFHEYGSCYSTNKKCTTINFVCFFSTALHKEGCCAKEKEYLTYANLQYMWVWNVYSLVLYNIKLISLHFFARN